MKSHLSVSSQLQGEADTVYRAKLYFILQEVHWK